MQKKALRIINHENFRAHTNASYIKNKILKLDQLVQYQTQQILYKGSINSLPSNIQSRLKLRDSKYNMRGKLLFNRKQTRTTLKSMTTLSKGIAIWNDLDYEVKTCPSLKSFKSKLYVKYLEMYSEGS